MVILKVGSEVIAGNKPSMLVPFAVIWKTWNAFPGVLRNCRRQLLFRAQHSEWSTVPSSERFRKDKDVIWKESREEQEKEAERA